MYFSMAQSVDSNHVAVHSVSLSNPIEWVYAFVVETLLRAIMLYLCIIGLDFFDWDNANQ